MHAGFFCLHVRVTVGDACVGRLDGVAYTMREIVG